ncbi:hypothetical protein B0T24DRAFT_591873 [Lasiosphaeria ovina]|uniref:Uncharacterized protein n=1 Tax=Lasiosphaeria ovina TaxID=92902 RepID=A0AAE0KHD7_9PEZI|nr:hypothetical protein B0T24DRAFT_591873 [Lasiosphaeria ovina]
MVSPANHEGHLVAPRGGVECDFAVHPLTCLPPRWQSSIGDAADVRKNRVFGTGLHDSLRRVRFIPLPSLWVRDGNSRVATKTGAEPGLALVWQWRQLRLQLVLVLVLLLLLLLLQSRRRRKTSGRPVGGGNDLGGGGCNGGVPGTGEGGGGGMGGGGGRRDVRDVRGQATGLVGGGGSWVRGPG